jgi:hypothetical protein
MLLLGAGCTRCGRPYGAEGVVVLALREEIAFVQLACSACRVQTLALVTGVSGDPAEAQTEGVDVLSERPAVSEADVLEMRSFLADYQGDLRTLLDR